MRRPVRMAPGLRWDPQSQVQPTLRSRIAGAPKPCMLRRQSMDTMKVPCCPELLRDDNCDVLVFTRTLNYPFLY